ncbi:hypothetical protein [Streptomyces sp. NPDC085596]|uniref:hypothetical protein n=1 Tax=Streptomyces sp. NPDC085596 TaxID=3365731 RepID=UPI0037D4CF3B
MAALTMAVPAVVTRSPPHPQAAETVAAALTEHLQHISAPGFDAEDLEAPRNHVLVFHGVGGIGKTTLSRMLEAALTDAGRRPSQ